MIEHKFEKFEKAQNEMKEILQNKLIGTQFVEEEIVIDVKYVNSGAENMIWIDSGAPKSIISSRWLEGYLRDAKISKEYVKKRIVQEDLEWGKQYT